MKMICPEALALNLGQLTRRGSCNKVMKMNKILSITDRFNDVCGYNRCKHAVGKTIFFNVT